MSSRPGRFIGIAGLLAAGVLVAVPSRASAQTEEKPRRLAVAYFGESASNPGVQLGYEAAFFFRRPHELFAAAHVGGYYSANPALYGLLLYLEGGYRLNFRFGLYLEARVGLGYVSITRSGSTDIAPDGTTMANVNTTGNYLMPIGTAGLGFDLLPLTKVPLSIFARAGGLGRYNSDEAFSGGLVLISGLAYQFGTGKPRYIDLPVPPTPPAEAPYGNEPAELAPRPANVQPPSSGPAEQAPLVPTAPLLPPPVYPPPLAPPLADPPPSLPPPPVYPPPPGSYAPPPGSG